MLNLTPFGFTRTEGSVYERLTDLGPSSGYSVAKSLGIARANAYQALDGLVTKGAARIVRENPKTYRALAPASLQALISQKQARNLEDLESALDRLSQAGSPSLAEFKGPREFGQLILRTATRALGPVQYLGPASLAQEAAPIWRKRKTEGLATQLWVYGDATGLPLEADTIDESVALRQMGVLPLALAAGEIGVLGQGDADDLRGYWSAEPLILGAALAVIASVVQP